MTANRFTEQRQIADDIQHLVPHKFLAIAQRLGRQHRVIANHHGILERTTFDKSVLEEKFNLLVKTKRPRVRKFLLPRLRRDFRGKKLGETPLLIRARASNLEIFVRKQRHHRFAVTDFNGFRGREKFFLLRKRHDARRQNDFAELARTAIGDGRFVGVQFHNRIVHAVTGERGEDVFHGVDFDIALRERRRAVGL